MPARGIQYLPIRYPREAPSWFVSFMDAFTKDVLVNLDVRNAIPGSGIEIEGAPDTQATISSSTDLQQLMDENYILAEPSAFLANARVLTGEVGIVLVDDDGPGSTISVSLAEHGVNLTKLPRITELSVIGNPSKDFGPVSAIAGSAEHDVLSVQLDGSDLTVRFGAITHQSVSDFDEAAQDAVGAALTATDTVNLTYVDGTPAIYADVLYQMSITSDSSGLRLAGDSATPGNNRYWGTDSGGTKGFYALPGGGGGDTYYTKAWTPVAIGGAAHTQYPAGSYTTPSKGTGDYGQYLDRRLATAGDSSANTRAGYRSSATADEVYANATRGRAAGFEFVMRAAIRSFRSDMRCFFGLAPNAALGVSADPSGNINVIGIGKDAADSTFQIFTNDGSGTASKTDTGITCAAGVTLTLKLSIPVGGGSCDWSVTNEDTGASASGSISSDLPATDAALYWNLYVQNGPTGGTVCAAEYSLVGIRYPATPI